jgi:hypothetical protein
MYKDNVQKKNKVKLSLEDYESSYIPFVSNLLIIHSSIIVH